MKNYFWVKPNYSWCKTDYLLAYKSDSEYISVENGERYGDIHLFNVIPIKKPVFVQKTKITTKETGDIMNVLRTKGIINNGVAYVTGKWLKPCAKGYGLNPKDIKDDAFYYVSDGRWEFKPKEVSPFYVSEHIIQYCNESILEHNNKTDTDYDCMEAWNQ